MVEHVLRVGTVLSVLEAAGIEDTFTREPVEQCLNLLRLNAGRQEGRPAAALITRSNDAAIRPDGHGSPSTKAARTESNSASPTLAENS